MNSLTPEVFEFDRREFARIASACALGTFLLKSTNAMAQGTIDKLVGSCHPVNASIKLFYFIDGLHFDNLSNIESRANLSLYMPLEQSDAQYVSSVILTDKNGKILGVRYYDASMKMSTGSNSHVPYTIFNNIYLRSGDDYQIYYEVTKGSTVTIYKYTLTQVRRSRLTDSAFIPESMQNDFGIFMGQNPGLISSPFQFYTENGTNTHTARGHFVDIDSSGQFRIDIEFMHADADPGHYMRYFVVADPVGRLLGFVKKDFNGAPTGGGTSMRVSNLTEGERVGLGLSGNLLHKLSINDCPFIRIATEDVYDALAANCICLA